VEKVLFISYIYPPIAGGGVFRTLKFTKYLPQFGWKPIVISVNKSKFNPKDNTLLDEIPETVQTFRTNSIESKIYAYAPQHLGVNPKWYQIIDNFVGWLPFAISKAEKVIKKEKPKIIFSTSPPVTNHLIAYMLKKKTGIPWVADFRDPWTDNFMIRYPTKTHHKIEQSIEHKFFRNADRIIFVTDKHRKYLIEKLPNILPEKCVNITNGYDPDDFKNNSVKKTNKFTITYIGTFYGKQSPKYFFSAIDSASKKNDELKKDLEIRVAGKASKEFQNLNIKFGLNESIKQLGYQPHKKAIELMKSSSCLFLLISLGPKSDWVYTGKIYEYMASETPILATVPKNSPVREIIKATNTGLAIDTDDINGIKDVILTYYKQWKKGELYSSPNWQEIEKYNIEKLTNKLSEQFYQLC